MIRVVVLTNRTLRSELVIGLAHVVNMVRTANGGIVYLDNGRQYIVNKEDYLEMKKALLTWNTDVWRDETRTDLPRMMLR